jgi:hypothetical protein
MNCIGRPFYLTCHSLHLALNPLSAGEPPQLELSFRWADHLDSRSRQIGID